MHFIAVLVLLGTGLTATGERHSLTYIYTALSKPVTVPGIHEFTAMGLMDDHVIDYFDSETKKKEPRQTWMNKLDQKYWDKGSQSRQSKQQWFKVNIDILMKRLRQNDTDVHILQWMHGCEADMQPDGNLMFHSGMDTYSYDGRNFLSFNDAQKKWEAEDVAANPTKEKWDGVKVLSDYTKGYLENECLDWLKKFLNFRKESVGYDRRPEVYVWTKNANVHTNIILMCLATGFSSTDTVLQIKRDDRVLTKRDGVQSSGVRPNHDDTFQRQHWVEVLKSDKARYSCEVTHAPSGLHLQEDWIENPPDGFSLVPVVAGLIGIVLVVVLVGGVLVLFKKGIIGGPNELGAPPVEVNVLGALPIEVNVFGQGDVMVPIIPLLKAEGSEESLHSKDSGVSSVGISIAKSSPESRSLLQEVAEK